MLAVVSSGSLTGGSNIIYANIIGGATVVAELERIIFSCSGSPADANALFAIAEASTAGTSGTSLTTFNTDRNGQAPQALAKNSYSANPTLSADMVEIAINQRASFEWIAPPGFKTKLTANYGLAVVMLSGPSVAWNVTVMWKE